jgi:hypothetical protein
MNRSPQARPARARSLAVSTILCLILSFHLPAGGRRRAVAAPRPSDELAIAFVDAPGGTLDAGSISGNGRHGKIRGGESAAITKRTFGIRIGRPSREAQGSATLRAFLETADPRSIVRLDGIVLGTQPRIIERFSPIGIITSHRLEIEVAASAPEGALVTTIGWDVTTE